MNRQAVDILSGAIFFQLILNIAFLAVSLFQIEVGIRERDPQLTTSLMATTIVMSLSFVFCFIASKTTSKIAEVGEVAYNAHWRRYPNSLQKYTLLIVQHSHQTVHFHGFHFILCNLDVFMRVTSHNNDGFCSYNMESIFLLVPFIVARQISLLVLHDDAQDFTDLNDIFGKLNLL